VTEATEHEFLLWFYQNADFGPASCDVRSWLKARFENEKRKSVPANYRDYDDDDQE
jgi:hypothetical protein